MNMMSELQKKGLFKNFLITLILSLDYSAMYLLYALWKVDLVYFIVIVAITTIVAGAFIQNEVAAIFIPCISLVVGIIFSVLIVILPPLAYNQNEIIELTMVLYVPLFVRLLFFGGLAAAFAGGLLGSFIGKMFS